MAANAPAAPQQQAPQTFNMQARKRNQRLGSIAYDGGGNVPRRLDLRNAGYLERLSVMESLTFAYATAGPTGSDFFGQYGGIVQRITVMANSVGLLYDCTGEMAFLITAIDSNYNYGAASIQQAAGAGIGGIGNQTYVHTASPGTSTTTNTYPLVIPVDLYLANKPYPLGLFQTALNSQETSIEVRFRPIVATAGTPGSGLYTGNGGNLSAGATGSIDIQQTYFDPIADQNAQPNLTYIHQWREFQFPLTADGDNEIRLPPSNYYSRVIMWVITDTSSNVLSGDDAHVTRLRLAYGANLAPYDEPFLAVKDRMARLYDFQMPAGVYVYDFLEDTHMERDIINSAATTDLRLIITTSGATYSGTTGGAYVKVAVEQLIPLGLGAGAARVQGG